MNRTIEVVPAAAPIHLESCTDAVAAIGEASVLLLKGEAASSIEMPPGRVVGTAACGEHFGRIVQEVGAARRRAVVVASARDGAVIRMHCDLPGAISLTLASSSGSHHVLREKSLSSYVLERYEAGTEREVASLEFSSVVAICSVREAVFASDNAGDLVALDAQLRERWRVGGSGDRSLSRAFARSLIAVSDVIVRNLGVDSAGVNGVVAGYAIEDGRELWRAHFPDEVTMSEHQGRLHCTATGRMWVIDPKSGEASVNGQRAFENGDTGDVFWSDAAHLWYGSLRERKLRLFDPAGLRALRTWELPATFGFAPFEAAHTVEGWTYLLLESGDAAFRDALGGVLRISPEGDLPEAMAIAPFPRHRISRVKDGERDAYRVAIRGESLEELNRFGLILAKSTGSVRGVSHWADERSNPHFGGLVEVAVPIDLLSASEQEELKKSFEFVAQRFAAPGGVMAGDEKSPIRLRLVPLATGELDSGVVSLAFPAFEPEGNATVGAGSEPELGDELPDMIVDALRGASEEPVWRLGIGILVLGGAVLSEDFAERRSRANSWLLQRHQALTGFPQELAFHTGVLMTRPGAALHVWGGEQPDPEAIFEDVKSGLMQLAGWINAKKVSVDEGLASVQLMGGLLGQLAGSDRPSPRGKKPRPGLLGKLWGSSKPAKGLPPRAKPVFDAIEAALSEVERQLRQQS